MHIPKAGYQAARFGETSGSAPAKRYAVTALAASLQRSHLMPVGVVGWHGNERKQCEVVGGRVGG